MTKKDKLVKRFLSIPKDFTFDELIALFKHLGFEMRNKGKTSGSRVEFTNVEAKLSYFAHKPHPGNIVKTYVLRQLREFLTENKIL
ncbi:MAG: type II toxin-antitoxin system HicA family toxin [Moheibacter sp.]